MARNKNKRFIVVLKQIPIEISFLRSNSQKCSVKCAFFRWKHFEEHQGGDLPITFFKARISCRLFNADLADKSIPINPDKPLGEWDINFEEASQRLEPCIEAFGK